MKHKFRFVLLSVVLVFVITVICYIAYSSMDYSEKALLLRENVDALTEQEVEKNDGALWSNPEGTSYCCGSGNVRDCSTSGIPLC